MRTEKHRLIVSSFPKYWDYDYCILGNFAYTTHNERFILDEFAMEYDGQIDTPGYHFNQAIKEIQFPKRYYHDSKVSYPYKAIPCSLPYAFYVDISKAYAQLAERFGLDCSFREGRYFAFGSSPFPEVLNQNKYCRALLVSGVQRKSRITEWKNGNVQSREFSNRNFAPMLSGSITFALHAIQAELSAYSVYCHTDGLIVPFWKMEAVTGLLRRWGLSYRVKHEGITTIYGVGSYDCGDHRTKFTRGATGAKESIRHDFSRWWVFQLERNSNR